MAKPQKSTAQSEVPGLVKKGPLYYLKRDWQLYALMLLPMVFIIVFKYFAYTGLSVAFLDYKIGKGYAGSKFVGLKIFEKVFKHRDFTKAVVNTLLLNVLDLIFSFPMPIILALLLDAVYMEHRARRIFLQQTNGFRFCNRCGIQRQCGAAHSGNEQQLFAAVVVRGYRNL